MRAARRGGLTLLELLVVITILGVAAGTTAVAMRRETRTPSGDSDIAADLRSARAHAVASGRRVTVVHRTAGGEMSVTALPDGRVLSENASAVDPLSGRIPGAEAPRLTGGTDAR